MKYQIMQRQGAASRHNLIYWRYGEYAGVGPGAHGRLQTRAGRIATAAIRLPADLPLPASRREHEALADLKAMASKNVVNKSCIGMGYYDTLTIDVPQMKYTAVPLATV